MSRTSFLTFVVILVLRCLAACSGTETGTADGQDADAGAHEDAGMDGDAGVPDEGDYHADAGGDTVVPDGDAGEGLPFDPSERGGLTWQVVNFDLELEGDHTGTTLPLTLYLPDPPGPHPTVVFLHGFQLGPPDYTSYGEHLASWGFVAILPQMPGGLIGGPNHRELKEYTIALLDWLEADSGNPSGVSQGKADMQALGMSGHSMGGKIALLVCSEDARPRASFTVDPVDASGGPFPGDPVDYPSVTPELMPQLSVPLGLLGETVNATCQGPMCQACAPEEDNFHQYFLYAQSPALVIEILGASHMSFLDDPDCGLTCSVCPKGNDDPDTTKQLTRKYLTAFYMVYLAGREAYRVYLIGTPMQEDAEAGLVEFQYANGF